MLLINWHFLTKEVIEFDMVNFLTGMTGVGKSTIVDALQLLFLGDTSGSYFNKAANPRSNRNLKGYLRGYVTDDEKKGIIYLRMNMDFSSYIVVEILDTEKNKPFCLGAIFDSFADGSMKYMFFHFDDPIPENLFHVNSIPMNIPVLKEWILRTYGRDRTEESNKGYQEVLKARLGSLNDKFLRLFRKAVPFTPDLDIKTFIAEFLIDAQNKVDIQDMRENIRYYKQMEQEAEIVKKRCQTLDQIKNNYLDYQEESQRLIVQAYLIDRALEEETKQEIISLIDQIDSKKHDLQQINLRLSTLEGELFQVKEIERQLIEEKAISNIEQQLTKLTQQKQNLEEKIDTAQKLGERFKKRIESYLRPWNEVFQNNQNDKTLAMSGFQRLNEVKNQVSNLLTPLQKNDFFDIEEKNFYQWRNLMLEGLLPKLRNKYEDLRIDMKKIQEELIRIKKELEGLRSGIKPYDQKLLDLQSTITTELSRKFHQEVKPAIFCELLDIKDPHWRDAIEGYLYTQRFYLLIKPEYYIDALSVYDRLKFEKGFFDLGLVDLEKVVNLKPKAEIGSLAEEIVTSDPFARAYVDYLLGRVMKVERVEDLRQHRTAITPTCMLYQNFVARQLDPKRYKTPYIGQRAIEEQIRQKTLKNQELMEQFTQDEPLLNQLNDWIHLKIPGEDDLQYAFEDRETYKGITHLNELIQEVIQKIGELDLNYLNRLNERIDETRNKEKQLENEKTNLEKNYGGITNEVERISIFEIPTKEEIAKQKKDYILTTYNQDWITEYGEPRFQNELKARIKPQAVQSAFHSQVARTKSQRDFKWGELVKKREQYNSQYKSSMDSWAPFNNDYDQENDRLNQTLLPQYEAKIRDAKEKAQIQFQEDFISKIRGNIEIVERQIMDLNDALKNVPFGRVRYHFHCSANELYKDFYNMIKDEMLLEGYNLFSPAFQERYRDTIDRLFSLIVTTEEGVLSAEQQAEIEENLKKFTDFRTFLDFDLKELEDGREIRLSRTIDVKSGGETQNPFYIAVLASFVQIYRVKQVGFNNTFRLIVFDEAYSKMDHQRIKESIKLIKSLGLQVILAAPTEKIGDIAPFVDRNLCVLRLKNQAIVRAFDPQQSETYA